ncbi:complement C1q tumor necrosis factor-related protein 3 [Oreochromis niloticus]|uniref:Complement C1q-like protein 3 n=1 Tax=Oreochromis niloticus TaxID=8128 RepID=I3JLX3_ORENI|nr:complement C1q tumor necrosis factor-related protein 3 [Oreochromis niloticus]
MNPSSLLLVLLCCGLTLAQGTIETQSPSCVDTCNNAKEFGAMREKIHSLETKMMNIENRLTGYESRILQLEQKERNMVIFSAGIGGGSPLGPFNTDQTIIYNKVFINTGNAYNELTGIFTAPVSGVYFFTYFCHSGGVRKTSLHLYKNNEVILHIHDHQSADAADNGGNAVFLQLQQGDTVYVRLKANSHVYRSSTVTNFSGFLVKKTN